LVDDWNKMRRGADAVNDIEVIELHSDPKYGKFIQHEPARARVDITRRDDEIVVEIDAGNGGRTIASHLSDCGCAFEGASQPAYKRFCPP
jgi:hypothetical protein